MQFLQWVWDQVVWLIGLAKPQNIQAMVAAFGPIWVSYAVLAAIVFSETGLLVGFFLPGDSLLFATGFLASPAAAGPDGKPVFDLVTLWVLLSAVAIAGDAVNYALGWLLGAKVLEKGRLRFVKHEHLVQAHEFYERHGPKAIVLARFVPIVRTFVPFIAGVARMSYFKFAVYNVIGGIGWVISMSVIGYFLGQVPFVQRHFEKFVVGIVIVSVLPIVFEYFRARRQQQATPEAA
ncbi:MAG TPA: VTT domain-containing protein [Planctomycetia bacterium]|nr:VTT domain-containing protein [Planctomycetia bacterium]